MAFFFLALMSLLRLGTWLFFKTAHVSFVDSLRTFSLGFRYDARVVGVVCLLMLLFGSIRRFNPFVSSTAKRFWLAYLNFFAILLIIFYVFDFLHFRYLAQRLNASALSFLQDATISAQMVWQTYPVVRILLGMAVGIYLLNRTTRFFYKRANQPGQKVKKASRLSWFFACFLLAALAIFGRVGQFPLRWSDAFNTGNDFDANIALNPIQSFLSSLSFRSSSYDRAKVKQYYPFIASYLGINQPDSVNLNFTRTIAKRDSGLSTRPNIVVVICESFSAYKSSMWGNPLNTTPFFNELRKHGIFFDNCFTPHFGTARGVWATITGIPDVELSKTASRNPAMVDQHTIINDFNGYDKLYFLGGSTSWANIRGLLTDNIQNLHIYEEGSYDVPKIDVWGISDKNLFLQANKVLSQQHGPFFAIIQTADNHRPYSISKEDLTTFSKLNFPLDSLKKYGFESNEELNAFRYTDFGYQKFIEAARKSSYFDNTIFAFVGDHGIHGNAGNMFPPAWTENGLTGYHVPLLFYSPKLLPPRLIHDVASQVDVLPTVAGLANLGYTNTTLGRDLLQSGNKTVENIAFIMDHNNNDIGVVKSDYYYTRQPSGKRENFVWANFRQPQISKGTDSLKNLYREYTTAFFETARYMLLNNKKIK